MTPDPNSIGWPGALAVVGVAACYMGAIAFDPTMTGLLTVLGVWVWRLRTEELKS